MSEGRPGIDIIYDFRMHVLLIFLIPALRGCNLRMPQLRISLRHSIGLLSLLVGVSDEDIVAPKVWPMRLLISRLWI